MSPHSSKRCHSHAKVVLSVGSRCQVWNGTAEKTSGGLRIGDLIRDKNGRIRSKAASRAAKKNNTLKKENFDQSDAYCCVLGYMKQENIW